MEYNNFETERPKYDSDEEVYFTWYLQELVNKGFIVTWEKITEPYKLTDGLIKPYIKSMKRVKDKVLDQTILKPSIYTPDFRIVWHPKSLGIFVQYIDSNEKVSLPFLCDNLNISIVEIKGSFDFKNMTRLVTNNIKFLYHTQGIYTNLIKIPNLFKQTFVPERYLITNKSLKARKIKFKAKTISQFIL